MDYSTQIVQYVEINGFRYPRPIRKAPTSLRRRQSDSSLTGSSDHKKRESKSYAYRDTRYTTLLESKGSFMDKSDLGITDTSKSLCRRLLNSDQDVPKHSLFRDDLFETTCRKIQDRNEARIIQDIGIEISLARKRYILRDTDSRKGAHAIDHMKFICSVADVRTGGRPAWFGGFGLHVSFRLDAAFWAGQRHLRLEETASPIIYSFAEP